MNPSLKMPGVTDLGDGRIMVESRDKGHCFKMIEANGSVSMVISLNDPPPKPKPDHNESFQVRDVGERHEIVDAQGVVVACCADAGMAKHIVYENMRARKASSGA